MYAGLPSVFSFRLPCPFLGGGGGAIVLTTTFGSSPSWWGTRENRCDPPPHFGDPKEARSCRSERQRMPPA